MLTTFGMENANGVNTPLQTVKLTPAVGGRRDPADKRRYQEIVGSLIYALITTRPDLAYAASLLGRFASHPTAEHWTVAKHVLRYLTRTKYHGLTLGMHAKGKPDKIQ